MKTATFAIQRIHTKKIRANRRDKGRQIKKLLRELKSNRLDKEIFDNICSEIMRLL